MRDLNELFFDEALPKFISEARTRYSQFSFFPCVEDLSFTDTQKNNTTTLKEHSHYASIGTDGAFYNALIKEERRAVGLAYSGPADFNSSMPELRKRFQIVCEQLNGEVKFHLNSDKELFLKLEVSEQTVVADLQIISIIRSLLAHFFDLNTHYISSIKRIEFPHYTIGNTILHFKKTSDQEANLDIYFAWANSINGRFEKVVMRRKDERVIPKSADESIGMKENSITDAHWDESHIRQHNSVSNTSIKSSKNGDIRRTSQDMYQKTAEPCEKDLESSGFSGNSSRHFEDNGTTKSAVKLGTKNPEPSLQDRVYNARDNLRISAITKDRRRSLEADLNAQSRPCCPSRAKKDYQRSKIDNQPQHSSKHITTSPSETFHLPSNYIETGRKDVQKQLAPYSEVSVNPHSSKSDVITKAYRMIIDCLEMIGFPELHSKRDTVFLQLGLDSIQMAELEMELNKKLEGNEIPYGTVLKENTINKLADYLMNCHMSTHTEEPTEILEQRDIMDQKIVKHPSDVNKKSPQVKFTKTSEFSELENGTTANCEVVPTHCSSLTKPQRRILFECEMHPTELQIFNEYISVIKKDFQPTNVQRALNHIIMIHFALRTLYTKTQQVILSGTECFITLNKSENLQTTAKNVFIDVQCKIPIKAFHDNCDHVLIVFHHIAVDGASMRILQRDIFTYYESTVFPTNGFIRPFVRHEEEDASGDVIAFWKCNLENVVPKELPTNVAGDKEKSCGKVLIKTVTKAITEKIEKLAMQANSTPFRVVLALFQLLMCKLHGFSEFTLGLPYNNRKTGLEKNLVGCFLNLLVHRFHYDKGETLKDCLDRCSRDFTEIIRNNMPYEELLAIGKKVSPEEPFEQLFSTVLVEDTVEDYPSGVQPFEITDTVCKYDQMWFWQTSKESCRLRIEYDSAKFTVARMEWYCSLLFSLVCNVERNLLERVDAVSPFPSSLINKQVIGSKRRREDHPITRTFLDMAGQQMLRSAGARLFNTEKSMIYSTLRKKSSRIASLINRKYLKVFGCFPPSDNAIGVYCHQSITRILLTFACWKTRLIPFNLNIDWPIAKQKTTLGIFRNCLIITEQPELWTEQERRRVISIADLFREEEKAAIPISCHNRSSLYDVLYITCTSGTTGAPKCVVTEYHGHNNLPMAYTKLFYVGNHSTVYQVVNYAFDIYFGDITLSFMNGSSIRIADDSIPNVKDMSSGRVTHSYMMPSYLSTLTPDDLKTLESIEHVFFGGEQMQRSAKEALIQEGISIHEKYGTSEQTVYSTAHRVKRLGANRLVGLPYMNMHHFNIDQDGHLTDGTITSEVVQWGVGISRGYYGREDLIEEKYVDCCKLLTKEDLFISMPRRAYHTGDMLSWQGTSYVFQGRNDSQIKINGKLVRISEVQEEISLFPEVHTCVVIEVKEPRIGSQLVAYVKFAIGSKGYLDHLRKYLHDRCASHVIPRYFIEMIEFPLNANGKVDRAKLPKPDTTTVPQTAQHSPPKTDLERKLCAIYSEILNAPYESITSDFFKLGGDSIRAMYAVQEIKKVLGVEVSLRDFFKHPSVGALSTFLVEQGMITDGTTPAKPDLEVSCETEVSKPNDVITEESVPNKKETRRNELLEKFQGDMPLSPQQEQLWLVEKLKPDTLDNFVGLTINMEGSLNLGALMFALNKTICDHTALRSLISTNEPRQAILSCTECYHATHATAESTSVASTVRLAETTMISTVFRGRALELNITFHHMITDGRSLALTAEHFAAAYDLYAMEGFRNLPRTMYHQFCNEYSEKDLEFWSEYLRDYQEVKFEYVGNPINKSKEAGNTVNVILNQLTHEIIEKFSNRNNCSVFHLLTAAVIATIQDYSGSTDVTIGTITNGRNNKTKDVVGMFANAIPLRCNIAAGNADYLRHCVHNIDRALQHQNTPLSVIIEKCASTRTAGNNPFFNHVVNFQNTSVERMPELHQLKTTVEMHNFVNLQFEQSWMFYSKDQKMHLTLHYDPQKCGEQLARNIVNNFQKNLKKILSPHRINQIRRHFSEMEDIPMLSMHQIIQKQQISSAESLFLRQAERDVSYQELFSDATEIYRRMCSYAFKLYGVSLQPDDIVAICLKETIDSYQILFTCLMFGLPILCIHPANPEARVSSIIDDSSPKVFVTNEKMEVVKQQVTPKSLVNIKTNLQPSKTFNQSTNYDASYCIYTSGSTGTPKGIVVSTRNVLNMVKEWTKVNNFQAQGQVYMFSTCSFDGGLGNILGAPINGGIICIASSDYTKDFDDYGWLDVVHCTSGRLISLMKTGNLPIGTLNVGGEAFPHKILESYRDLNIVQLYGPSEATCFQTSLRMKPNHKYGNIGNSNVNNSVTVQKEMETSAQLFGEISILGVQVARGYMNSIRVKSSGFRYGDDTMKSEGSEIFSRFCTGDYGWIDSKGGLHFAHRKDEQAKINGVRIEVEDIKRTFSVLDGIDMAVAKIHNENDVDQLVLFYSGVKLADNVLSDFADSRLPFYMIPHRYVHVPQFILTVNGKVDKSALEIPKEPITENYKQLTNTEQKLINLWKEKLHCTEMTVKQNFFQAGGNSMIAVQLGQAISAAFKVNVTVRDIFRRPTIEDLAVYVNIQKAPNATSSSVSAHDSSSYFLTNIETSFHMAALVKSLQTSRSFELKRSYNCGVSIDLNGISRKNAVAFVRQLMMKHPALRTVFVKQFMECLSGTECYMLESESIDPQFDYNGVLLTTYFFFGSEISLSFSHLVVDGRSMAILAEDFRNLLFNKFAPRRDDYVKFLHALSEARSTFDEQKLVNYYARFKLNYIGDLCKYGKNRTTHVAKTSFKRSVLTQLAEEKQTTEFIVLMWTFGALLHPHCADTSQPVSIGFPVDMRTTDFLDTVAFGVNTGVVNMLPTKTNWQEEAAGDIISIISEPFHSVTELVKCSQADRLFDVMLTFHEFSEEGTSFSNSEKAVSKFPMSIFAWASEKEVIVEVHHWNDQFSDDFVEVLLEEFSHHIGTPEVFKQKKITCSDESALMMIRKGVIYDLHAVEQLLNTNGFCGCKIVTSKDCADEYTIETSDDQQRVREFLEHNIPFELIPSDIVKSDSKPSVITEPIQSGNIKLWANRSSTTPDIKTPICTAETLERSDHPKSTYFSTGFPLSPQQEQMYFLSLNDSDNFYLNPYVSRFKKPLLTPDFVRIMQHATMYIIQNQESFRLRFREVDGASKQELLSMTESYYSINAAEVKSENLERLLKVKHRRRYNLKRDGPIQMHTLETDDAVTFLLLVHHIVVDATSTYVWAQMTKQFVSDILSGRAPQIRRKKYSYLDYASAAGSNQAISEESVIRLCAHIEKVIDLKSDQRLVRITKDNWSITMIAKLAKKFHVTPFVIFLTVIHRSLKTLLKSKYLTFGIASDNRSQKDRDLIGYFLNYLVIPLDGDGEVSDIAQSMKETLVENLLYARLFKMVRKKLPDLNSLYSVFINCRYGLEAEHNLRMGGMENLDVQFNEVPVAPIDIQIDLSEDAYLFDIAVSTSLLAPEVLPSEMDLELRKLTNVIEIKGSNPSTSSTVNGKVVDLPSLSTRNLLQLQAIKTPHHTSMHSRHFEFTYKSLLQKIQGNAYYLRKAVLCHLGISIRPDTPIAIIQKKSVKATLECFAVTEAGGCYVPIDIQNPHARISNILLNCHCHFYVSERDLGLSAKHLTSADRAYNNRRYWSMTNPYDAAYIIHTSGTTGPPKGSVNCHKGVINMACAASYEFHLRETDTVFQFTNFVFDNSVLEYFMALSNGASLYCDYEPFTPRRFVNLLMFTNITYVLFFPGLVELFDDACFCELARLRYWIVGAEKLSEKLFQRGISAGLNIIQNYGPTETTCFALFKHMRRLDHPNNIGRPINNCSTRVVDIDKKGELLISGTGLMRGYVNQNTEPFDIINGMSLYKSGDIVRQLPNGDHIFIGRVDNQIKLNGHRIGLGEIEDIVRQLTNIEKCVCLLDTEQKDIVCFYTGDIAEDVIKKHCSDKLPKHMIPKVIKVSNFPLTDNFKVDKRALLKTRNAGYQPAPSTKDENFAKDFLSVVEKSLNIRGVRMDHDFFELGGNSLNCAVLAEELSEKYGTTITIDNIYDNPNLKELFNMMQQKGKDNVRKTIKASNRQPTDISEIGDKLNLIWTDLGVPNTNGNQTFFEVGGSSIQLISLSSNISTTFGVHISIQDLIQKNFDKLCELVQEADSQVREQSFLKAIRKDDTVKFTLVFFHPLVGGGLAPYVHLIDGLKSLQHLKILTIEHPNTFRRIVDDDRIDSTIENLVSYYNDALRDHIQGHLVLIGSSLGGRLAYECATQLHFPCQVINIDGCARTSLDNLITFEEHREQMKGVLGNYVKEVDVATEQAMIDNAWDLYQMTLDYELQTRKDITMHLLSIDGGMLGWDKYTTLRIHRLNGRHEELLLPPNVITVIQHVRGILN